MIELRFHSFGSQGGLTTGKLLAIAAVKEQRHVQAFPTGGVERRSAPVTGFVRIADEPIRIASLVDSPDHIVLFDSHIANVAEVTAGLKPGGNILINSENPPESFSFQNGFQVVTVDATRIAVSHGLGSITHPIIDSTMLGAIAKMTGCVGLDAVVKAIEETIPLRTRANVLAATRAYELLDR